MTPLLKVAFYYHSTLNKDLTDAVMTQAVNAVRKAMPYAEIWHLRGPRVPKHAGVDKDILFIPFRRIHHQAMMESGPTLFLDIDCWVQRDVYEVFYDRAFDAAICVRAQYDFTKPETWGNPPYNAGVIFSRSQKFWQKFAEHHEREDFPWNDATTCRFVDQFAGDLTVKRLPGSIYNYTPHDPDEDLKDRAILHYKGEAKKYWMKHREC